MPSKNTTLRTGDRFNPITKKLWKEFVKEREIDIDFKTFRNIIETSNETMRESVIHEEAGVELPERLGHVVVNKYKKISKKRPVDWINTNKLGKFVPLLNLHSFGYMYNIRWYTVGTIFKNRRIYRFVPYRIMTRAVAKNIKSGKQYFSWNDSDFWSTSKLQRSFDKFFKQPE